MKILSKDEPIIRILFSFCFSSSVSNFESIDSQLQFSRYTLLMLVVFEMTGSICIAFILLENKNDPISANTNVFDCKTISSSAFMSFSLNTSSSVIINSDVC